MDETFLQEERVIEAHIAEARARLGDADARLRAEDEVLAQRASERRRFTLLGEACTALEELAKLDASDAFWGGCVSANEGDAHVQELRTRVRGFEKEILAVEARRDEIEAERDREEETLWLLEDDLCELREREEERKLDWLIEREATELSGRTALMPWSRDRAESRRLRRALTLALTASLAIGLLLPWVDLPVPEIEPDEVAERLTRLIAEARPVQVAWKQPEPQRPPEPRERPAEPVENVPVTAEATEVPPEPTPAPQGILAFRDNLSASAQPSVGGRLGSRARISRAGEAATGESRRSLVTSDAAQSSGGIDVGSLSRAVGDGGDGRALSGVDIARAESSIGGSGGRGDRSVAGGGPAAGRTDEEIQIVFDRHKSALYRLYNRELREDPALRGQMVLRLVIQPDGSVSLCELRSTDMRAPRLADQVVARVRTFDFGAKEVPAVTIVYPIDFLPAT